MRFRLFAVVLVGLGFGAVPLRASDSLRRELSNLAKDVVKQLGNGSAVQIGVFSAKSRLPGLNSGPGIEQILTDELNAIVKGFVRDKADVELSGDYLLVQASEDNPTKVIKIKAALTKSATGQVLANLELKDVIIGDNKGLAEILQPTVGLPPTATPEKRRELIEQAARTPKVFIHGPNQTLVSPDEKSPFAVEILVRSRDDFDKKVPAKARSAKDEKGQAFVNIERGEIYEVRIHNGTNREVAVSLSIDGIDHFQFSKDRDRAKPKFTHWIMSKDSQGAPTKQLTIPGWFNSAKPGDDTFLSFLVVAYGQGAVSKDGVAARGNVGVIRVGIFEATRLEPGQNPRSGDETGFGPPIKGQVEAVRYSIGSELASIAVRYTRDQR